MDEISDVIGKEDFQELILSQVKPLKQELGRGSYGRVYEVEYCGTTCAAKEVYLTLADAKADAIEKKQAQKTIDSFMKECLRCSKLRHPNIVQFLGVYYPEGEATGMRLPVMVMERMATNLTSFVKQQTISVETKFSIISDVACGLCCLHSQKPPIVHRDLTPNNVLLTNYNVAKIGDFGVSNVIQAGGKNTTGPGTLDFMPPEALEPGPYYDLTLDIFSFAGIILHVFTQEWPRPSKPVEFNPKTRKRVALSEVQRRAKYLNQLTGESAVLKQLIEECLDEDPTIRPPIEVVRQRIMCKDGQVVEQPKDEKAELNSHIANLYKIKVRILSHYTHM